jgi:hypothetical protein
LKTVFLVGLCAAACASGHPEQKPRPHRYAEVGASETLWRERYAHCDYGFYVVLPHGFVGHSTKPPNPNHGFVVRLPEVGSTQETAADGERVIWVNAEYNAWEIESLSEAGAFAVKVMAADAKGFKEIARDRVQLDNRPAIRIKAEYDEPQGRVIAEQVIAFRAGILYEIGLVTKVGDYAADGQQYAKILAGFRYWRIHYCS